MIKRNFLVIFGSFGLAVLAFLLASFFLPETVKAAEVVESPQSICEGAGGSYNNGECSCVPLGIPIDDRTKCPGNTTNNIEGNVIYKWLLAVIRFLSAGVGIAVTGGIVYGSVIYIISRDNAAQVQRAVLIIVNALIGLVLYILMFAILNFLIPGGILT